MASDPTTITAIVGAVTGIGALGLSTYNTVVQRLDGKSKVAVEAGFGFSPGDRETLVILKFANSGKVDVTLTGCGLWLPGNKQVIIFPRDLPKRLAQGEGAHEFTPLDDLKDNLRENGVTGRVNLRGFVTDAVGRRHMAKKSLRVEVDPGS